MMDKLSDDEKEISQASEEEKEETEKPETETKEKEGKHSNKKDNREKEEIEQLKAELAHWKNEYYRSYADTQNLRKTLEKDHQEAMKYRAQGFIEGLLPILDSFYLVLSSSPENPEVKNYVEGFNYIYRNLVAVLENEGVKEIAPEINKPFDPMTMAALETTPSDGDENIVTKVYSRGYALHGRVIRPASVQVTAKPNKENPNEENK